MSRVFADAFYFFAILNPNDTAHARAIPSTDLKRRGVNAQAGVDVMKFTRITVDPAQMGGVPCIRKLRIPVATVVGMTADGMTSQEILEAYPDLEPGDLREALAYAAETLRERGLPLVPLP